MRIVRVILLADIERMEGLKGLEIVTVAVATLEGLEKASLVVKTR
jgi:hypothetical protein